MRRGWKTLVFLMFLEIIFQGVPKELQRSILEGFWGPFESPLGVFFETLEGLWLFLGIVWVQNVARIVKMGVSKAILVQVEVARGLSEVLNASILKRFASFVVVFFWVLLVCYSRKKGFVHHGCSVALQLLFAMC